MHQCAKRIVQKGGKQFLSGHLAFFLSTNGPPEQDGRVKLQGQKYILNIAFSFLLGLGDNFQQPGFLGHKTAGGGGDDLFQAGETHGDWCCTSKPGQLSHKKRVRAFVFSWISTGGGSLLAEAFGRRYWMSLDIPGPSCFKFCLI